MKPTHTIIAVIACMALFAPTAAFAQFPQSVICQFERIATAELDSSGKLAAGAEASTGEIVISNLNSTAPTGSGNVGTVAFQVLRKSKITISLAEITGGELRGVITLFLETGVVMYTKHEILRTVNGARPFGFVEIGRFRPLK